MAPNPRNDDVTASRKRLDGRPTAQKILDSAADVFYRKGYASASVQDDEVGILKSL
jgi:AcrR family transcriptional regulator